MMIRFLTPVAFILLLSSLFEPLQQLSQLFNMVQSATASLHKLYGLIDQPVEVSQPANAEQVPTNAPIEIDDLTFGYAGGDPVLAGIDLHIAPIRLCTDNAVMGAIAVERFKAGLTESLDLDVYPGVVRTMGSA